MLLVFMLIAAFLIAFVSTWSWLRLARAKAWLDRPNVRSSHHVPIPLGGGTGIVVAFLAVWVWQHQASSARELSVIAAVVLLAVVGLIDDFYRLGIKVRLVLQLLAVALLWPMLLELPELSLPFSIKPHGTVLALLLSLAIVWLVNLYNFMDGIDALAASETVFVCTAMAGLTVLAGFPELDPAVLILGAAAAGFLFFNLPPARIFMGDAGSYFLGLTIATSGLHLIAKGMLGYWALPVLLGTFVADASTTLVERVLSGAVWYHPHRSHAYQLLAARWQSHGLVVLLNGAINVLWLFPLAWWSQQQPDFGLWITLLAWLPLVLAVRLIRKKVVLSS